MPERGVYACQFTCCDSHRTDAEGPRCCVEVSATATSGAEWLKCGLSFYLQTADIEHSVAAAAPNTIVLIIGNRWGFAIMLKICRVQQL